MGHSGLNLEPRLTIYLKRYTEKNQNSKCRTGRPNTDRPQDIRTLRKKPKQYLLTSSLNLTAIPLMGLPQRKTTLTSHKENMSV